MSVTGAVAPRGNAVDGQRFDEITRAFATGTSRRRLLRGVATGLVGSLAGALGLGEAEAARTCKGSGGKCGTDRECCQDDPSRCVAGKCCPTPRYCPGSGTCCEPGLKCCDDTCVSFDTDPANCGGCGVVCPAGGCHEGACFKAQGETCATGSECGSGFCADGVCCDAACERQCEGCNLEGSLGTCVPMSGETCSGGVCVNGSCCLGRQVYDCAAEAGVMCCQDEPCCPLTGQCCTDCFYDSETGSSFMCCPAEKVCGNRCCDSGQACVPPGPGILGGCYDARLVCVDGQVCPEECCGGVCCGSDQFCLNGTCVTTDIGACTTDQECPAGEQCVGVTLELVPPSGEGGEPTIITNPGTCCPSTRVCSIPAPDAGQPDGPPTDFCCGHGSRCGGPGTCCSVATYLQCGGSCACSPRGTRVRF